MVHLALGGLQAPSQSAILVLTLGESSVEAGFSDYQKDRDTIERVIGSLVGVSGHTFDTLYDLLFTTERVIAVIIQHPADISCYPPPVWQSLFIGSGGTMRREQLERRRIAQARRQALQERSPDELVNINPMNFEIRYSEVTSVEIVRHLFQSQLRFYVSRQSTKEQIFRFTLPQKQIPEAQRLLELVLSSKTRGK